MTEVKTTFAAHGNPWAQLIKPETQKPETQKQKMQKQAKQPVKPAVKTGQPSKPKLSAAQASARIDPEKLVVTDMPFPGRTVSLVSKYAAKFATLRVMCAIAAMAWAGCGCCFNPHSPLLANEFT